MKPWAAGDRNRESWFLGQTFSVMDREYTGQDYDEVFDIEQYIEKCKTSVKFQSAEMFGYQWLVDVLRQGHIKGKRLLEIGTGPMVRNMALLSPYFDEIVSSDIAKKNRDFIYQWWRGDKSEQMLPLLEDVVRMDSSCQSAEERMKDVRSKLVDVVPSDVMQKNPVEAFSEQTFDAVIMKWVLDAATDGQDEYRLALKNVASLLPRGGCLIAQCIVSPYYRLNGKKFRGCNLSREEAKTVWEESDFSIILWKDGQLLHKEEKTSALFNVFAKRK